MAQLVVPDASLLTEPNLWVPGRKPVGPVKIDWSHPLAKGLEVCWVPRKSMFDRDFVTGERPILSGGDFNPVFSLFEDGLSQVVGSSSHTSSLDWPDFILPVNMDITDGTFLTSIFYDSVSDVAIGLVDSSNRALCTIAFGVTEADVAIKNPWFTTRLLTNENTDITELVLYSSVGFTFDQNDAFLISNGKILSTAYATDNPPVGTIAVAGVRFLPTFTFVPKCWVSWGMVWNRRLSEREVASINRDPYQFLIPA